MQLNFPDIIPRVILVIKKNSENTQQPTSFVITLYEFPSLASSGADTALLEHGATSVWS